MIFQLIIQGIFIGVTITFIAFGYSLIYSLLRFVNFAHGELVILAGYICYFFYNIVSIHSFPVCIILTVLITGFIGILIEKIAFKPLRNRNRMSMLISSLGVSIIIQSLISLFFSSSTLVFNVDDPLINIFSMNFYLREVILLFLLIITFLLTNFSLINLNVGLAIRAISINPVLSDILGLNSDKIVSIVFFTASALAALVGISLGVGNGLTPSMGFQYSIWAFVVAVISGLGGIRGIFTTGILFGILINFSISFFSPLMAYAIALFLVSLVLLFKPDGLFGIKERII